MNEHFITCTVTSLHKLALFVIVLVTALWLQPCVGGTEDTTNNFCRVATAFSGDSRKSGPFFSSAATLARYFHVEIFLLVDESNTASCA